MARNAGQRIPPHNIEAEMATLGSLMLGGSELLTDANLQPSDFYAERNRIVFEAMTAIAQRGEPVDLITLKDELLRQQSLDYIGGLVYLMQLGEIEFTTANLSHYAGIVRTKAIERRLIDAANAIAGSAFNEEGTAAEQLSRAEQAIFDCGAKAAGEGWVKAPALVHSSWSLIEERVARGGGLRGISAGLVEVDRATMGLAPGDLMLLAARPGMGKTGFATGIMERVAAQGLVVGFFSLEMTRDSLMQRMIAASAKVSLKSLLTGKLSEQEWARCDETHQRLHGLPFAIDDHSNYAPMEMESQARRLRADMGSLDLLIVDYIGKMSGHRGKHYAGANDMITDAVSGLKSMAKNLKVPTIALCQLNREVEKRQDKRPMLSDLRDSGSLEQEADIVAFLYRAAYYERNGGGETEDGGQEGEGQEEPADPMGYGESAESRCEETEFIVAKHRFGATGFVKLAFFPELTRFDNLATGVY